MYKVYILESLKTKKTYVGQTIKPTELRVKEHNEGLSKYTKAYRPWKLIYFEQFYCQTCRDMREQFFKTGIGYKLRKLIAEHYMELNSALQKDD